MFTNFQDLMKNSEELNQKLAEGVKETHENKNDDRFWYPAVDKAGNGSAVIRFLPPGPGEPEAYVKVYSHEFKDPTTGRWYIENCLTTLGQEDPVAEYNKQLWDTGIEENKNIARRQKRKVNYYANVYIIKDSQNPENEGQVKLFKFSTVFYNMIKKMLMPEYDDVKAVPVFDLLKGANLRIRIKKKGEHRNYDDSSWDSPEPLSTDHKELERIWLQCHPLQPFKAPDQFKPYDELKKRFNQTIGLTEGRSTPARRQETAPEPEHTRAEPRTAKTVDETPPFVGEDDDDLDFFSRLATEE